ncbi:hypothetical protein [Paenibacillus sp. QZ-Y1]|uniref:hypothetical protein n=1 Tax=Paenibacillus sp. QZ-Y1 TaxID=3414511 RepID=UPI003F7A29C5
MMWINNLLRGENLQYLFTILFILGFMAFFVFLVLMILSIRKHNRITIRHIILSALCFVIASVGLYGMLTSSSHPTQPGIDLTKEHESGATTAEEKHDHPNQTDLSEFQMTTDEFKNKFNSIVGKYRLNGLSITVLNMKESPEHGTKTFEYAFNDDLRMVGVLNSDQRVQEVRLFGTGDVGEPTGGILLTAIATLILTTNSDYTYNDAQDVVQDIGLLDRDVKRNDFDGATVRNGCEYRLSIQDDISIFGIKAAH